MPQAGICPPPPMARPETPARPVYLTPFKAHLPVTAIVSLAYRVCGLLLMASLPLALQLSLADEASWQHLAAAVSLAGPA